MESYWYIAHHGVKGQQWGKMNGPPYPLKPGDHSSSEKKAGWKSSVNGASSLSNSSSDVDKKKLAKESVKEYNNLQREFKKTYKQQIKNEKYGRSINDKRSKFNQLYDKVNNSEDDSNSDEYKKRRDEAFKATLTAKELKRNSSYEKIKNKTLSDLNDIQRKEDEIINRLEDNNLKIDYSSRKHKITKMTDQDKKVRDFYKENPDGDDDALRKYMNKRK